MNGSTSKVLCKYFMHGACRYKNPGECPFAHDLSLAPNYVCKYYLQGCCAFGDACRYDHVRPEQPTNISRAPTTSVAHLSNGPDTCTGAGGSISSAPSSSASASTGPSPMPSPLHPSSACAARTMCIAASSRLAATSSGYQEPAIGMSERIWEDEDTQNTDSQQHMQHPTQPSSSTWSKIASKNTQGALPQVDNWEDDIPQQATQHAQQEDPHAQHAEDHNADCQEDWQGFDGEDHYWEQQEGDEQDYYDGYDYYEEDQQVEADDEQYGPGAEQIVYKDESQRPLCGTYAAYGACSAGNDCPYTHGQECEHCHKYVLHPLRPEEAQEHVRDCKARHGRLAARLRSANTECGICLEKVMSHSNPNDRKFGLMACDHPFCLKCIRAWRREGTADVDTAVRTCPICRTSSHFVTPSLVWPADKEEKEAIVSGYKAKLATIDCQHFRKGDGKCPFGSSCFYRHMYKDGTLQDRTPVLRTARDDEGGVKVLQAPRLSEFMETLAARRALQNAGTRRRRSRPRRDPTVALAELMAYMVLPDNLDDAMYGEENMEAVADALGMTLDELLDPFSDAGGF